MSRQKTTVSRFTVRADPETRTALRNGPDMARVQGIRVSSMADFVRWAVCDATKRLATAAHYEGVTPALLR